MERVLITTKMMSNEFDFHIKELASLGLKVDIRTPAQNYLEQEILAWDFDFDVWICGDDEITAAVVNKAESRVKAIIKWGVGLDSIDVSAVGLSNIELVNFPNMLGPAVSELAVFYAGALCRKIIPVDTRVRGGEWYRPQTSLLSGAKVLIIGYGDVGRNIATRLAGFSCEIAVVDPGVNTQDGPPAIKLYSRLSEVSQKFNFLFIACPYTPKTHNSIRYANLARLIPGGYLINVSRGGICGESDLLAALDDGTINGAALDVYSTEPLCSDSPLRYADNLLLGSHNASNTFETKHKVTESVVSEVRRIKTKVLEQKSK